MNEIPMNEFDRIILKRCRQKPYDVVAFMPDAEANAGRIVSYMHVGQHSEASFGFYLKCRPADPADPDAIALLRELRAIGYNPRLVKRITRARK